MTPTNTDYLLQVTTPVTDRAYGAAGTSDGAGRFNDHLSQASTYSADDSRNLGSDSQRPDTARYERDDRSWNPNASKPNSHDNGSSSSSQTSRSSQEDPSGGVRGSTSATEDTDGGERDNDKSDDSTAAEVAGASQAAKDNSPKAGTKSEAGANANSPATAKVAAANKKTAAEAGDRKATGIGNGSAASGTSSPDTVTQHADEAAKLAAETAVHTATTSEGEVESQEADPDGKQSKALKGDASTTKSNKGSNNAKNDGAAHSEQPVDGSGTGETASGGAKKANETVDPGATLAGVTATKNKSDADESSDNDSHAGLKTDARGGAGNDASVSVNKVDAAQLAGGIPSTADASANASSKGKDDEQATKPIVAKGEPAAAAFARMARNNIAGSNDSAPGTNDLPQVDPSRFIGRVAKAFQTAQDRGGTLQLRLSPPELGALRIELNVKDGVMSASLQAETANARRLLLDHLPALRDRLAEQNIRVDRFDVDVRQEGSGSQADTRGSQQQQFQHQPDQPAPRRQVQPQVRTREVATPEKTVTTPNVSDAGLNLIV
jgi:flagellar hook-length control protein FliK